MLELKNKKRHSRINWDDVGKKFTSMAKSMRVDYEFSALIMLPLSPRKHSRSAFTLIELLIVIAIIALLAAILFPAFSSAREMARRSSCQSNLKQLGLGIQQYTQDYDELYPCGNRTDNYRGFGWAGQIFPYVKSDAVYQCPNDVRRTSKGVSYSYNRNHATFPVLAGDTAPTRTVMLIETELSSPAAGAVDVRDSAEQISEAMWGPDPSGGGGCGWSRYTFYPTGPLGQPAATACAYPGRHSTGSNYLLSDGHVKWLRGAQVSPGYQANSENEPQGSSVCSYGNLCAAGTGVSTFSATFSAK